MEPTKLCWMLGSCMEHQRCKFLHRDYDTDPVTEECTLDKCPFWTEEEHEKSRANQRKLEDHKSRVIARLDKR